MTSGSRRGHCASSGSRSARGSGRVERRSRAGVVRRSSDAERGRLLSPEDEDADLERSHLQPRHPPLGCDPRHRLLDRAPSSGTDTARAHHGQRPSCRSRSDRQDCRLGCRAHRPRARGRHRVERERHGAERLPVALAHRRCAGALIRAVAVDRLRAGRTGGRGASTTILRPPNDSILRWPQDVVRWNRPAEDRCFGGLSTLRKQQAPVPLRASERNAMRGGPSRERAVRFTS